MDFKKMSDESLEEMRKQIEDEKERREHEKKEEDYTVESYTKVGINTTSKDLIFKNGGKIGALAWGEGVFAYKNQVDAITVCGEELRVLLKGHDHKLEKYTVLWKNDE